VSLSRAEVDVLLPPAGRFLWEVYLSVYPYALSTTLAEEGGLSDNPADPGGRTMQGITQRTYDAWRIGQGLSPQDVALIEQHELEAIYYTYWEAIRGDELGNALAVVAFDCSVNHGAGRVLQWLAEEQHDAATLTARRLQHYTDLNTWPTFGKGWTRRAARVLRAAGKLEVVI
jgi:lysozyme family protein